MSTLKQAAKRLLGPRLTLIARTSLESMPYYPRYVFGGGKAGTLQRLQFEITFACNARCRMCLIYGEHRDHEDRHDLARRGDELSTDEIQSVLRQCSRMGTQQLQFTGGEPFLRKDLPELIRLAKQLKMTVGVITNGSLLSEECVSEVTAAGLDWLHVSVDGPGEVHNSIRRVPNMFARIESTLLVLRTHRERLQRTTPKVTMGCTVSALNQFHLHELVPIAARWQAELVFLPVFFDLEFRDSATQPSVLQLKPENWNLPESIRNIDVEALADELALVTRMAQQSKVAVSIEMPTSVHEIRKLFYSDSYFANNKCFYPWFAARMNPYGDIYCCLRNRMGSVRQNSLEAIWNSPQYITFRQQLRRSGLFPECQRCCALNPYDLASRMLPRFSWITGRA